MWEFFAIRRSNVATLTEGVLKAMMARKLKDRMAVLLALVCLSGAVAFLPPVMGQPPTGGKKEEDARNVAAKLSESDTDKLQGKWQIMSITLQGKVFKR